MPFNRKFVNIIGAGFAGIECALFLASHGIKVHIFDSGKVFEKDVFDESATKSKILTQKILKRELYQLESPLVRKGFAEGLSEKEILLLGKRLISENELIKVINATVHEINPGEVTIIASGTNTDEIANEHLKQNLGGLLNYTYMPLYPIFEKGNIGLTECDENYLLQLSYTDYINFINSVVEEVNKLGIKRIDMLDNSLEKLVMEGKGALKNFALLPVSTEKEPNPYATMKLKANKSGLLVNGISSNLPRQNQERIFKSLEFFKKRKLLSEAKMIKVCHITSPYSLNEFNQALSNENLFFAGSILGISGALDCTASGLYTAQNVVKYFNEQKMTPLPETTAVGKMAKMIVTQKRNSGDFLEDYQIFAKDDLNKNNIVDDFASSSMKAIAKFKEEYNGKYV